MDSYRPTKMISKSIQTAVKKIREIWLYTLLFLVSAYIFRAVVDKISNFPQKNHFFVFKLQSFYYQHHKSTNLNRYFSFASDLKIVRMKASKLRNKGDPYLSRFPNLMLCRKRLKSSLWTSRDVDELVQQLQRFPRISFIKKVIRVILENELCSIIR